MNIEHYRADLGHYAAHGAQALIPLLLSGSVDAPHALVAAAAFTDAMETMIEALRSDEPHVRISEFLELVANDLDGKPVPQPDDLDNTAHLTRCSPRPIAMAGTSCGFPRLGSTRKRDTGTRWKTWQEK